MVFSLNKSVSASYRHLATVFFIMVAFLTVIRGIFHEAFGAQYMTYLGPVVVPIGIMFFVFMVRLIRNLGVNERLVRFILGLLFTAIVLRITTVLFIIEDGHLKSICVTLSSSLLLIMQSICVYFMCINLFIEVHPIKEKLWASVCVYFMIGATFGTLYSLLINLNHSAMGVELTTPIDIYIMGLIYSFNVISGLDPIYANASETIQMTAVLESIFNMLFMVILIGRLLGSKE